MSIKRKMTMIMSLSVSIILLLNMVLNYSHAKSNLQKSNESQLLLTTRQIAVSLEQSRQNTADERARLERQLKMAAMVAAEELSPDMKEIHAEQLTDLSQKTGVSGISLVYKMNVKMVTGPSSDPERTGIPLNKEVASSSLMDLLNRSQQNQSQHQGAFNPFWTVAADSVPTSSETRGITGYYYDGTRNYIINVFLLPEDMGPAIGLTGQDGLLTKMMDANPGILEITGILPARIEGFSLADDGQEQGPFLFGTYHYADYNAEDLVQTVNRSGQGLVGDLYVDGEHYIQSYVPVVATGKDSYVLRVVYSDEPISTVLKNQIVTHTIVSGALLLLVLLINYLVSGMFMRPIQDILLKVKEMAGGRFETRLSLVSRDELGVLANHINMMAGNLGEYTAELEKMNEENRSMREYLESIINQTADAIHITDQKGNILRINHAFEKLYGWTKQEILGKSVPFVPPSSREEWKQWEISLKQGEPLHWGETVRLRKDGSEVVVSISQSPIFNKKGKIIAFVTISRDMTERNKIEELLRRSEKLTTVGQLAAGVAHEIRNPLTTLRGFLQLQQQTETLNPQHVDIMMAELDRINLIVSEFLILAKPQANFFQNKDIRYILGDVVSLLDSQAHLYGIQFVMDFAKEPIIVHCEENQLKQVFINVLKNAMEAMPKGGGIGLKIMKEDNQALIGIIDEGEGIPDETLPKLGEPFFTSKETGTGLGLMVSQRIIEAHKGTISINSMMGWGTMVTITLPMALQEEEQNSDNQED
ncbi:PAS domain S-box protein [Paenibacillus caui]|uniref:PAS domain S-box protein n=1 Tax=Paenibacillus caui TaxID=2873927 RepID=UPI001CA937A4|nr:PAS domain S-box protein [Paenibacillus caui]